MCKCCAGSKTVSSIFWLIICLIALPLIILQAVSIIVFMDDASASILWRKVDTFGGFVLLWMMLILTLGFAVIPSSVFSNFWKKRIFQNFLFLDLESLQILYNASRIKQKYGGLTRKFLSLTSEITAPWTIDYKKINYTHPSYELCKNLMIGIKTTTYIHFQYKLKQQSLWRKVFCCICDRKNVERDDIKYNYYHKKEEKTQDDDVDDEENIDGESLEINTSKLQFTEFYPTKFAEIRAWNGLSSELYIKTFEKSLLAFITNSKSGMYFFYTSNGKFLIKSLKKSEYYFFRKIFNEYYEYLKEHQNTLINRFYGMYGVKHNKDTIYFIVMESIFYSNLNIDTIYDLKGSTKGRISKETEKVLKDNNWTNSNRKINIGMKAANLYKEQLRNDTLFLQKLKIMDYSLLVGIHNVDKSNKERNKLYRLNDSSHLNMDSPYLFTFTHRGMPSRDKKEIYYGGIIDILQKYNAKKKVENVMRRMRNNQKEISCAPPDVYADRMCDFLNEYIV